ncbi:hypothetical protein SERLADRAFT_405920 [Serpula lacrymans var. lacrymans S7.9]|uniref:Retrotransposon gag domain-containing protein n=1 Tax=Serpula lacrymans var. lacrymans (strain S7.9) TaxID=578457 RepID=F8NK75_SERL9|nr:uncharacterized protein SERLADRAFT_405920 [Serpula lacrymans var. lacrymans S7.9]EGO28341.1 hypothetical protein SERLADRAFT_405920 [Serpula lacrymans var. lacrymans S7.9]
MALERLTSPCTPRGSPIPPGSPHNPTPAPHSPIPTLADLPRMELENKDVEDLTLAQALLAQSSRNTPNGVSARTKIKELDTFNGFDPQKICSFIVQCQLNFNNCLGAFRTDRANINYAISFLKGMVLDWFESDILTPDNLTTIPIWMGDYSEFLSELHSNFGPHNPIGDAESQIKHLQMCHNQCLHGYMVEFNCLTSQIQGWGKGAL